MFTTASMTVTALGVSLAILLGLAAWLDVRQRRIPNGITAAVALLGLAFAMAGGFAAGSAALAASAVVLAIGIAVWRLGWLGGGDVKLVAALSLWAGPAHLGELLLVVALAGGALAVVVGATRQPAVAPILACLAFELRRLVPVPPTRPACSMAHVAVPADAAANSVPYGVAIALGGAWLLHRLLLA